MIRDLTYAELATLCCTVGNVCSSKHEGSKSTRLVACPFHRVFKDCETTCFQEECCSADLAGYPAITKEVLIEYLELSYKFLVNNTDPPTVTDKLLIWFRHVASAVTEDVANEFYGLLVELSRLETYLQ